MGNAINCKFQFFWHLKDLMNKYVIREKCEYEFTIMKTREGCEADILVRPINEQPDLWLFESNDEDIRSLQKITIGSKKSKYDDKYVDNLVDSFSYWYKRGIYNITCETGNTPQKRKCTIRV